MKTKTYLLLAALAVFWSASGCEQAPKGPATAPATEETESERMDNNGDYPITGRVTTVAPDKTAVTLDHEDIPGLMPGMEMEFTVEDGQILEGIEAGSKVQGRLKVEDGKNVITELQKQ